MTRRIMLVGPPRDPLVAGHARLLASAGWTPIIATHRAGDRMSWPRDLRVTCQHPAMGELSRWRAGHGSVKERARRFRDAANHRSIAIEAKLWQHERLRPAVRAIRRRWDEPSMLGQDASRMLAEVGFNPVDDGPWLAGEMKRFAVDLVISFDLDSCHVLAEAARQIAGDDIAHVAVLTSPANMDRHPAIAAAMLTADGVVPLRPDGLEWLQRRDYRGVYSLLPLLGVSGDMEAIRACRAGGAASARRTLIIDGRQDGANRGFVAVHAVELAATALRDAEITILDPAEDVALAARLVGIRTGLRVRLLTLADGGQQARLLGRARCLLMAAASGPTSPVLIEAMAAGAFPISSPGVAADWIVPGSNGALVPPNDPDAMARALAAAMTSHAAIDQADATNAAALAPMLSWDAMVKPMLDLYGVALLRPGSA